MDDLETRLRRNSAAMAGSATLLAVTALIHQVKGLITNHILIVDPATRGAVLVELQAAAELAQGVSANLLEEVRVGQP